MMRPLRQADLEAYLDEALPADDMVEIEKLLRDDRELMRQLVAIHARRDSGVYSLGEIWRRHRLSCPTRQQLGNFLLGIAPEAMAHYIAFHLDVVGCRYCRANVTDLEIQQSEAQEAAQTRRHRYFQSSAGYLGRKT